MSVNAGARHREIRLAIRSFGRGPLLNGEVLLKTQVFSGSEHLSLQRETPVCAEQLLYFQRSMLSNWRALCLSHNTVFSNRTRMEKLFLLKIPNVSAIQ